MTPEILVGLIGAGGALSGALLGGLATFSGVVYQQKRQAKQMTHQRQTEMAHQAIDNILRQTQEVKNLAISQGEDFHWTPKMDEQVDTILLWLIRIPHADLREVIEAICTFKLGAHPELQGELSSTFNRPDFRVMLSIYEIQDFLGRYLRGEPIPQPKGILKEAVEGKKNFREEVRQSIWGAPERSESRLR
ncbi:hypothetical protein KGD83_21745 [Nocardiopsis akebiae]|uniref:Uncharacterized protein n=1 Tax=Nocardiopsis akebiae TaxID=2831968 RepID=A0ABX8C0J8_9ACTN|nr:hypothetical protein [Nocardiopsis akebiae]QUX27879.1 hypothetical protein KGD83_21745 [Nocardiopsis akebiae]